MNPKVEDFPALIHWLAEKYHDGAVHPIHEKVGVSPALVQLWSKGGVKNPSLENLDRLCAAYHLDFTFVRGLLRRPKRLHPIAGGSWGGVAQVCGMTGDIMSTARRVFVYLWGSLRLEPQLALAAR
jgi:hypothetical protein